ncbi:hypothetical protein D3C76_187380 [compost metagenome]
MHHIDCLMRECTTSLIRIKMYTFHILTIIKFEEVEGMALIFPASLDDLAEGSYVAINIPQKENRMLTFSVNASRPQGIGIYGPEKLKFTEKYSTSDDFKSFTLFGFNDIIATYYIAGWGFFPTSDGGRWLQNKIREIEPNVKVVFDDYMDDGDFNDLVVDITSVGSS